jgi:DNA end-binding protein Ku
MTSSRAAAIPNNSVCCGNTIAEALSMAARAIWKGVLKIGSAEVPVKLYAAVEDRKVHFHMLQGEMKSRVKQQMVNETGKAVARDDIRKGYEVEPGTYVVVEEQELQALKPPESRNITALRFVPASELSHEWYERPYYLGPDDDEDKYFALVESLHQNASTGIVRWTMRGKDYVGALLTDGDYLMLIKTRYAEEIVAQNLSAPSGPPLDAKELRMAHELVAALEGKFEPEEFHDEYRERVLQFVEAKAKGKHPRLPAVKAAKSAGSLDEQLTRSLAALKRGREKKIA